MDRICIKALVSGRVQGVFFRDSTRQLAVQLGITGHAINLPDGRVEVLACGEENALDQLIKWLGKGPKMANVTDLKIEVANQKVPDRFSIGW